MTAATADTAADYSPDLAPVSRLPQRDSLTAMTAPTTDTAPDHGPDVATVTSQDRHAFLKAATSARRHEDGLRVKGIGLQ